MFSQMNIPYIKIQQRGETFYSVKFKASFLLEHLNFHFRAPYSHLEKDDVILKNQKYIDTIRNKGIELASSDEGIQRRLQISRINGVRDFIENSNDNFLPSSITLSADISMLSDFEDQYLKYESKEIGFFEFPNNFMFSIIDGQHRLAGLSMVKDEILEQFEISAILLFNVSKSTAAKLFADINGKQKSVNKSLIYDLYSDVDSNEFNQIKKYHIICENFYTNPKSPLFRQIKMLGIGSGAVSQAFFIDYVKDAVNKTSLKESNEEEIFKILFYYFRAFQKTFPDDWPVLLNYQSVKALEEHADQVLKQRKSQLVKTNGFGAIVRAFPHFYNACNSDPEKFFDTINSLKGQIKWVNLEGTGKALQNSLYNQIIDKI